MTLMKLHKRLMAKTDMVFLCIDIRDKCGDSVGDMFNRIMSPRGLEKENHVADGYNRYGWGDLEYTYKATHNPFRQNLLLLFNELMKTEKL